MTKKKEQAEFFMNVLCQNKNKRTNPEKIRSIEGLIDELDEMQKTGREKPEKKRVQSANLKRCKSAFQHSPNLYKSREFNRSTLNVKQKTGLENQLNRSKQIIKSINTCLEEESKVNKKSRQKMYSMKEEWSEGGHLEKTFIRSSNMIVNPSALKILKDKRLKIKALSRIDNEYLRR